MGSLFYFLKLRTGERLKEGRDVVFADLRVDVEVGRVRGSLQSPSYLRCLFWLFTPPPDFCPLLTPQGVLNFVQYKFSHLAPRERQTMFELSKMFLLCLNYWKLETPAQFRQRSQSEDVATYKVNYTR